MKIPRFAFEKFPGADPELTTTMKSVGEAMALGRNFTEALGKAMRSMETKPAGFWTVPDPAGADAGGHRWRRCASRTTAGSTPSSGRCGWAPRSTRCAEATGDRPVVPRPDRRAGRAAAPRSSTRRCSTPALLRRAKRAGLSDRQIAALRPELAGEDGGARRCGTGSASGRSTRRWTPARPSSRRSTPYHYSTYDEETEVAPVGPAEGADPGLRAEPDRAGHRVRLLLRARGAWRCAAAGYETVMVNCNPETVSTDYDTADRLYFEPLTFEDVLEVVHAEDASGRAAGGPGVVGVIVQLGGQTPLGLAQRLKDAGVPIVGTSPGGDPPGRGPGRVRRACSPAAGLRAPGARHGHLVRRGQGDRRRDRLPGAGPAVVRARRPRHGDRLRRRRRCATTSPGPPRSRPDHPVLVDRFLDDAIEIDVDALCDGDGEVYLGGVMEHIEEAGIHSGDSACALPPITLGRTRHRRGPRATPRRSPAASGCAACSTCSTRSRTTCSTCWRPTRARRGPCRSSSKATAVPLAKAAARIMLGATIAELRAEGMLPADRRRRRRCRPDAPVAVKEAVLPFKRFRTRRRQGGGHRCSGRR